MAYISWEESYLGQLRGLVGNKKLIHPSIRAIIQNEKGEVLFIDRRGENKWGMPAGSMELEETILETLKREVLEETGLTVEEATLIAIYTSPKKSIKNYFGDEYQLFEFSFLVDKWSGTLVKETEETNNAKFFPIEEIPPGSDEFWDKHHREVFEDLKKYKGQLFLK